MAAWLLKQLEILGVEAEAVPLGKQVINGETSELDLPPVILGRIGVDPKKRTVLIYGHFDVQPVSFKHQVLRNLISCHDRQRKARVGTRNPSSLTLTIRAVK